MTAITFADAIGTLGAALIVLAYLLLQMDRIDPHGLSYSLVNGIGACGIAFSLLYRFNPGALAIEVFWLLISLFGVVRALRRRRSRSTIGTTPEE